jgi:predicted nicotinamide N-methyase
MGPFARILGADVLYEDRNAPAVADFLARHLAPGAEAWITDPNRPHARRFPDLARRAGLEFLAAEILPAMKHAIDVTLLRLRRPD